MRDYAELVELIRSFACNEYPNCGECEMILNGHECRSAIERQAADAIEELLAENKEILYRVEIAENMIAFYQEGKPLPNVPH